MANRKYIKGDESILFIRYMDEWVPISCEKSSNFSEDVSMIGTTTRDNYGWRTYLPLDQGYSIDFEGQAVEEDGDLLSYYKLKEIKRDRELLQWKIEDANGKYLESGTAWITQIGKPNPAGELVSFSMTLLGHGRPVSELDLLKHDGGDGDFVEYTDGENFVKYD